MGPRKGTDQCGWNRAEDASMRRALVTMMNSADCRHGNNPPQVRRLDRTRFRCVLLQSQVRPAPMIVTHETMQVTVQAPLAKHDYVIHALAADGADDAFDIRGNAVPTAPV